MNKHVGCVCSIALVIFSCVSIPPTVTAQTGDASALPLLSADGLQYVGGFRLPSESVNGESFSFGGTSLAFNPSGNSLFVASYHGAVAEVSIPPVVNGNDPKTLPFASFIQGFADPTEGHMGEISSGGVDLSGLMVSGNRLIGTASIYYDANNTQRVSHFSRSLQLNQPSFSGWSRVSDEGRSGFVSGWMTPLPSEWQARLGGPALTGQCCVPIVWRTSAGPAAMAFDPAAVGQPVVSAVPLLYYPDAHPTLGPWEGSNPTYGATTQIAGLAAIAGTRTVLYFGSNGLGPHCYGNGTADRSLAGTIGVDGALYCFDPTSTSKGSHAYPYRYQVWAYDMNDFAAVRAGTKQPWDVVPYGVWDLNFPTREDTFRLGGVAYDSQRQVLYVSQRGADPDGYASRSLIHAFRVNAAPGSIPPPASTTPPANAVVSSVTLSADSSAPQAAGTAVAFTAQPAGGAAPYQYKWIVSDGVTATVAATWAASNRFTWTPATENANYSVSVWVRSSGNTADAFEASKSLAFPITAAGSTATRSITIVANRVAPQAPYTAITWTATAAGGVAPHQFKWRIFDGTNWSSGADWSATSSFIWTPSASNANYRIEVWVRSAGKTADVAEASAASQFPIQSVAAAGSPVASVSLGADKPAPQPPGSTITWTANPSGGTAPLLYKWSVFDGTTWTPVGTWTSTPSLAWTPSTANANYRIRVWVKGAANTADQAESAAEQGFTITSLTTTAPVPPATAVSAVTLSSDKPSTQPVGAAITITAAASGGTAPFAYKWFVSDGTTWTAVGTWTSSPRMTWFPSVASTGARVRVWVKSASNPADQAEAVGEQGFVITQ